MYNIDTSALGLSLDSDHHSLGNGSGQSSVGASAGARLSDGQCPGAFQHFAYANKNFKKPTQCNKIYIRLKLKMFNVTQCSF